MNFPKTQTQSVDRSRIHRLSITFSDKDELQLIARDNQSHILIKETINRKLVELTPERRKFYQENPQLDRVTGYESFTMPGTFISCDMEQMLFQLKMFAKRLGLRLIQSDDELARIPRTDCGCYWSPWIGTDQIESNEWECRTH